MGNETLYELLLKYRKGDFTMEEMRELDEWYEEFSGEEERISAVPREKLDQLFYAIERNTFAVRKKRRPAVMLRWAGAAACAIILAALFLKPAATKRKDVIHPFQESGSWQAELIVGNGSRVKLDSTPVIEENGAVIASNGETGLEYSTAGDTGDGGDIHHTIIVPLGREYALTLSDGSRVRLNAGSELTYPVSFGDDRREVKLKGEGYFEVAKSSVPFTVNVFPLSVNVLGTSFNVAAYDDDDDITTTLVSGSVSIQTNGGAERHILESGHQFSYQKTTGNVTLTECDTDLATAWLQGEFKFRDMRLDDIINRLARWYGYDVRFEDGSLKNLRFSGAAEKERPVEYTLDMLRYVTEADFTVEEGVIVIGGKSHP